MVTARVDLKGPRMASCHPERQYHAKDMCRACYIKAWHAANPDRVHEYVRRYKERNPNRDREYYERNKEARRQYRRIYGLANKYGLTPDERNALLMGGCGICGATESGIPGRSLHIDHDHQTGAIRGALCAACNTGIGLLRDDPVLLKKAIAYLRSKPHRASAPRLRRVA